MLLRAVIWGLANWLTLVILVFVWPSPTQVLAASAAWLVTCACAAVCLGRYIEERNRRGRS